MIQLSQVAAVLNGVLSAIDRNSVSKLTSNWLLNVPSPKLLGICDDASKNDK